MEAMEKRSVQLDVTVLCPDCGANAEIRFSRKHSSLKLECSACGIVHDEIVWYGAGAIVGDCDG